MSAKVGVGATQIVVFALAAFDKLFEATHSCVIATGFVGEGTHSVMGLFFAIQA